MGSDRRHGTGNHMREAVVCRHRSVITVADRVQIGVCVFCGQKTQYDFAGREQTVMKRGRLNGRWTLVHPPPLEKNTDG